MSDPPEYTSTLDVLQIDDDGRPLPFIQLGDVFWKSADCWMFVVVNASCDLQYVPDHVWQARGISPGKARIRNREESVLLLPGVARKLEKEPQSNLRTGLVRIDGNWYSVDWFAKQVFAVPHCALRPVFEDKGFRHTFRLQMSRAIELQQSCFSELGRIGLEVQPPLHREYEVGLYENNGGTLVQIDVNLSAVAFHTSRGDTFNAAVLTYDSLTDLRAKIDARPELKESLESLSKEFFGLHKNPFVLPEKASVAQLSLIDKNKKRKLLKFGTARGLPEAMASVDRKFQVVLSFVEKPGI